MNAAPVTDDSSSNTITNTVGTVVIIENVNKPETVESPESLDIENGISTASVKSFEKGVQDRKKLIEMSPPPYVFQELNKELENI